MKDMNHEPVVVYRPYCSECGRQLDADGKHIEGWKERSDREEQERKGAEKAAGDAQYANAPVYKGSIDRCMASKVPGRGAPYRCNRKPVTRVVRARDGRPMAVCTGCAHKIGVYYYNGWGGDPRPFIPEVEPEYVAQLPEWNKP